MGVTSTLSGGGEDWTGGEIGGRAASHRLAWLARKPALDLGRGRQLVVNGESERWGRRLTRSRGRGMVKSRVHHTVGKSPIIGDFTDTATERYAVTGPVNGVFRFKIQKYKSQIFFKKTVTATVKTVR